MKAKYIFLAALTIALTACTNNDFRTKQIKYSNTICLPNSPSDSLVLNIDIEYPVSMQNEQALKTIQTDLMQALLDDEVETTDGEEAVKIYAKNFEQGYLAAFQDDNNDSTGMDCWENIIIGKVMSLQNNILSYSDERYVYSGGPHGINSRHFYNYDITSGKYLNESDIFVEGYEDVLTKLLIANLIEQYEELGSLEDLIKSDFRPEDIKPNNNFYFTENEIVYVFNPYEIAPYYIGETEIVIALNEIKHLLREN